MRNIQVTTNLLDRLQELFAIKNPTEKQTNEYYKIDAILRRDFERRNYNIGDKIQISPNPCGAHCGCYVKDDVIKEHHIDKDKIYTIKHVHYFGGGCPSTLIEIEELPSTHSYENAITANGFKVLK